MEKAKLQEIIKNNTSESGEIDFSKLEEIVNAENQKKIDSIIIANKSKSKEKMAKLEEELNALKNSSKPNSDDPEKKTNPSDGSEVTMKEEKEKETQIKEFKKKAKDLKVDENLITSFIDSGSNLEKIELEKFKGKDKILNNLGNSEDDENVDSDLSKIEELLKL
jgi:tRNA(Phe) wybutosine-synthesizing methylase Tyw3